MNKRKGFTFYRSFYDAIKELPEKNQNELYSAIIYYSFEFKQPELTGLSKTIWVLIEPFLTSNINKFKNGLKPKEKQRKSKTEAKHKQDESKTEGNKDKDKDKDNNKDKDKDKEKKDELLEKEFSELWGLYPNKKGKASAFLSYKREKKKDKDLFPKVKKGIEGYIADIKKKSTEAQYIKHGSSFFNQKAWADYENVETKPKTEHHYLYFEEEY